MEYTLDNFHLELVASPLDLMNVLGEDSISFKDAKKVIVDYFVSILNETDYPEPMKKFWIDWVKTDPKLPMDFLNYLTELNYYYEIEKK